MKFNETIKQIENGTFKVINEEEDIDAGMDFDAMIGDMPDLGTADDVSDVDMEFSNVESGEALNHEEGTGERYLKEFSCGNKKVVIEAEDDRFEVEVYEVIASEYVDTMEEAEELFEKMKEEHCSEEDEEDAEDDNGDDKDEDDESSDDDFADDDENDTEDDK